MDFNGTSNYVTISDSPNFNFGNTLTVEIWINVPNANPVSPKTIVAKADDPVYSDLEFNLNLETDGRIRFWISTNGVDNALIVAFSSTAISPNQWYHVVGRYDGANLTVFLNGNSGLSVARAGNIFNGVANIEFARAFGTGGSWVYTGMIDECRIWNTARTQTQIRDNMCKKLIGNELGLVGYWRFDETTGNTAFDSQTNVAPNNGTGF